MKVLDYLRYLWDFSFQKTHVPILVRSLQFVWVKISPASPYPMDGKCRQWWKNIFTWISTLENGNAWESTKRWIWPPSEKCQLLRSVPVGLWFIQTLWTFSQQVLQGLPRSERKHHVRSRIAYRTFALECFLDITAIWCEKLLVSLLRYCRLHVSFKMFYHCAAMSPVVILHFIYGILWIDSCRQELQFFRSFLLTVPHEIHGITGNVSLQF